MKMRLLVTVAGFAIGFVLPVLAQEQNMVDPEVRQQIEAVLKMREEAINKNDAAAVAALYTQDAASIRSWESEGGLASGQQAIEKRYATELASSPGEYPDSCAPPELLDAIFVFSSEAVMKQQATLIRAPSKTPRAAAIAGILLRFSQKS